MYLRLGMAVHDCNTSISRLKREDRVCEASLCCIVRPYLKMGKREQESGGGTTKIQNKLTI